MGAAFRSGCPWREFIGGPADLAGGFRRFDDGAVLVERRRFPGRVGISVGCVWIEGWVSYCGRRRGGIARDWLNVAVVAA